MADKSINQLPSVNTMKPEDLLVLQQDNMAKKMSGNTLSNYLGQNIVNISSTQPTESVNKIWITPSNDEYELAEQSEVDELKTAINEFGLYNVTKQINNGYISAQNTVNLIGIGKHIVFNVKPNMLFHMIASNLRWTNYCFLKSYTKPTADGQSYDVCNGYGRVVAEQNAEVTETTPSDCNYILIAITSDSGDHTPQLVEIDNNAITMESGTQTIYISGTLSADVKELEDDVNAINDDINAVKEFVEFPQTINTSASLFQRATGNSTNPSSPVSSTTRILSFPYINVNTLICKTITVTPNSGYKWILYELNGNNYVRDFSTFQWATSSSVVTLSEATETIGMLIAKTDDSTITTDDYNKVSFVATNVEITIPDYYETQLSTALVNSRKNIMDAGISGDSFIFLTDLHWESNVKTSPLIVKKIADELNLGKIVCGGDLIQGGEVNANIALIQDCVASYKNTAPFYCLFGNHDTNTYGGGAAITKANAYALMQKQTDPIMVYGDLCYFYFDNPTTKTRYVCIDSGGENSTIAQTQIDWVSSVLADAPTGYHILVFAHIIYQTTTTWHVGLTKEELAMTASMQTICGILDTFNAADNGKKVEAIFGGHAHISADFATTGGIPIILTDCDARRTLTAKSGTTTADQDLGTVNECCFDIITVDYANETVKCVRIGRGQDRTITY